MNHPTCSFHFCVETGCSLFFQDGARNQSGHVPFAFDSLIDLSCSEVDLIHGAVFHSIVDFFCDSGSNSARYRTLFWPARSLSSWLYPDYRASFCPRCIAAFMVAEMMIPQIIAWTSTSSIPLPRLDFCRTFEKTSSRWLKVNIWKLWYWDCLTRFRNWFPNARPSVFILHITRDWFPSAGTI